MRRTATTCIGSEPRSGPPASAAPHLVDVVASFGLVRPLLDLLVTDHDRNRNTKHGSGEAAAAPAPSWSEGARAAPEPGSGAVARRAHPLRPPRSARGVCRNRVTRAGGPRHLQDAERPTTQRARRRLRVQCHAARSAVIAVTDSGGHISRRAVTPHEGELSTPSTEPSDRQPVKPHRLRLNGRSGQLLVPTSPGSPPARRRRSGPWDFAADHAARRPASVQVPRARHAQEDDHAIPVRRSSRPGNTRPVKDRGIHRVGIGTLGRAPLRSPARRGPSPPVLGRANLGRAQMVLSSFTVGAWRRRLG